MFKKKRKTNWNTQELIAKCQSLINNCNQEFIILPVHDTPIDNIEACERIMKCKANQEYYSNIDMFMLGNTTLVFEKIQSKFSPLKIEFEGLVLIASYIFSIVNETNPEAFPYENVEEIFFYISKHKKKMGRERFIFIVTHCLDLLHMTYITQCETVDEVEIIEISMENVRAELTHKTSYDYRTEIYNNCQKYRLVKGDKNDSIRIESNETSKEDSIVHEEKR